mgnify:CR=1 FL=1
MRARSSRLAIAILVATSFSSALPGVAAPNADLVSVRAQVEQLQQDAADAGESAQAAAVQLNKLKIQLAAVQQEAAAQSKTVDAIKRFAGKAPRGWECPGLTETDETIDLLSAAGVDYVADWVIDDQPTWIEGTPRPMLSVPYTVELNDIPLMAIQHHRSDEMLHRGVLQLDRLWQESSTNPRVMAISVHPYITGVPHRIAGFEKLLDHVLAKPEVAIMPGVEIADWYSAQIPPKR